MLAMFKSLVGDKAKKFSGKTDFLEAVCAASALVATADGELDDKELLAAVAAVKSNAALSGAFDARAIETTMDKMCSRAVGRVVDVTVLGERSRGGGQQQQGKADWQDSLHENSPKSVARVLSPLQDSATIFDRGRIAT